MSRTTNIFSGSYTTTINSGNRYRNYSIEDLNTAIIENDENTVISVLNENTLSINQTISRDPYRNTLLHTAIIMGNIRIIQKLIDMGADLRIKNKKGESSADMLSKSHLGSVIEYISDRNTSRMEDLRKEVVEKQTRISNLENTVVKLENTNNRITKEKQELEVEVVNLRKRKVELEESNAVLRQASKKPRN